MIDQTTFQHICTRVGGELSKEIVRGAITATPVEVCRVDGAEMSLDPRFGVLLIQTGNYTVSVPTDDLVCTIPNKPGEPVTCKSPRSELRIASNGVVVRIGEQ